MVAGSAPPRFAPPWVCKPQYGAGSLATSLVRNAHAWPGRAPLPKRLGDRVVQPYVAGLAASVAFLIGPHHCVPLMPAVQCVSEDGHFQYHGGRVPLPASLRERAVRLARSALGGIDGLQGYVGVDLVLGDAVDGSGDYAIEINPRLTTSYIGLRRLCRDNLAQAWLDVLRGREVRLTWREGVVEFHADGTVRE
jgi:predicted ATP-grasp superfamily ATP-dependent carboligase